MLPIIYSVFEFRRMSSIFLASKSINVCSCDVCICLWVYACMHVLCVWCICVHIYVLEPEPYSCKTDLCSIEFYTVHYRCYMLFIQSLSLEVISLILGARKSIMCVDVCALFMCVCVCIYMC